MASITDLIKKLRESSDADLDETLKGGGAGDLMWARTKSAFNPFASEKPFESEGAAKGAQKLEDLGRYSVPGMLGRPDISAAAMQFLPTAGAEIAGAVAGTKAAKGVGQLIQKLRGAPKAITTGAEPSLSATKIRDYTDEAAGELDAYAGMPEKLVSTDRAGLELYSNPEDKIRAIDALVDRQAMRKAARPEYPKKFQPDSEAGVFNVKDPDERLKILEAYLEKQDDLKRINSFRKPRPETPTSTTDTVPGRKPPTK